MTRSEKAGVLRQAALILEGEQLRTPWDRCTCGHNREDHIRGVGCVSEPCWRDDDQCRRFKQDSAEQDRDLRRTTDFLHRQANQLDSAEATR